MANGLNGLTAMGIEAIHTFILMTAIMGTAVDSKAPKIGGFGVGLAVTADIFVGGPLTGASMNPAHAVSDRRWPQGFGIITGFTGPGL